MNAIEWLEQEGFKDGVASLPCETTSDYSYKLHILMERFANQRSQILQAQILTFRKRLLDLQIDGYDEHFNIQSSREGKIL